MIAFVAPEEQQAPQRYIDTCGFEFFDVRRSTIAGVFDEACTYFVTHKRTAFCAVTFWQPFNEEPKLTPNEVMEFVTARAALSHLPFEEFAHKAGLPVDTKALEEYAHGCHEFARSVIERFENNKIDWQRILLEFRP